MNSLPNKKVVYSHLDEIIHECDNLDYNAFERILETDPIVNKARYFGSSEIVKNKWVATFRINDSGTLNIDVEIRNK